MHELSVAQRLVEVVCEELAGQDAVRVEAVCLRVGPLSGVVPQALRFAYDAATGGTLLEGSRLDIEEVDLAVFCPTCGCEQVLPGIQRLRCPVCQTPTPEVVRGRELEIVSIEVLDATTDIAGAHAGAEEE